MPNETYDAAAFLASWDDPGAPRRAVRLRTSPHGNINTVGLHGTNEADDLDPRHPRWREAIEPGVWPLVELLTAGWGVVTYDSCQGHAHSGTGLPPADFRVGILPRNSGEYASLTARLCRTVSDARSRLPATVAVLLSHAALLSSETGDRHAVLEVALVPAAAGDRNGDWKGYFTDLDRAAQVLVDAAREAAPAGACACACVVAPGCSAEGDPTPR
ncbi:hypothetical protein [Streptomyces microflavus]|uniref:hypothetical protein n=1 Tax=Streptomyces microflavus TaxID=1919 RepID=UPI00382BB332